MTFVTGFWVCWRVVALARGGDCPETRLPTSRFAGGRTGVAMMDWAGLCWAEIEFGVGDGRVWWELESGEDEK